VCEVRGKLNNWYDCRSVTVSEVTLLIAINMDELSCCLHWNSFWLNLLCACPGTIELSTNSIAAKSVSSTLTVSITLIAWVCYLNSFGYFTHFFCNYQQRNKKLFFFLLDAKKQFQQFATQTIASRVSSTIQSAFSVVWVVHCRRWA
jgi:hypothetical protein